jgi:hypothetical protein
MKILLLFLLLISLPVLADRPDSTATIVVADTTMKPPVVRVKEKGLYETRAGRIVAWSVGVLVAVGLVLTIVSYTRK